MRPPHLVAKTAIPQELQLQFQFNIKTKVYSKSQHLPSFSSTRLLAGKPQGGGGGGGSWPLASPNSWIWEGGREGHRRQESVREGTGAPLTQHGAL